MSEKITVRNGRFHQVARFVQSQLAEFDLSQLDYFHLGETRVNPWSGYCTYPKRTKKNARTFAHGYRITASVHPSEIRYPFETDVKVGSESYEHIREGMWSYIKERVKFHDANEAMVFICGHEAFHFLRRSRQVPGQNHQTQANAFGLKWLERWREDQRNLSSPA